MAGIDMEYNKLERRGKQHFHLWFGLKAFVHIRIVQRHFAYMYSTTPLREQNFQNIPNISIGPSVQVIVNFYGIKLTK